MRLEVFDAKSLVSDNLQLVCSVGAIKASNTVLLE